MELIIYMSLIFLMFSLELFSCSPAPKCPRSMKAYNISESKPNMAVLSGTEDTKRKYNFMVRVGNFDEPDCAGALVAELWVLTTGHCVDIVEAEKDYKVYGGGTNGVDEQSRDIVQTFSTNDDPGNSLGNKIGLLKLGKKFDKGVSYAKVPQRGWPVNKKQKCMYLGYGRKHDGQDYVTSRKLNYVEMEFGRDDISCGCNTDMEDAICLKPEKNKGPCRCNGGSIYCDELVVGLNLYVAESSGSCNSGGGGGNSADDRCGNVDFNVYFSNVGNFHNWLVSTSNGDIITTTTTTHHTTKGGGGGGGGGGKHNKGRNDSSINKSNSYMQTVFILYLVITGFKSDLN